MTRFHEPAVHACPECHTLLLRSRLASFNFFGTQDWSDGAPTAWWAPKVRPLVCCAACRTPFWIEDVDRLGELPRRPMQMGFLRRVVTLVHGDPHGWLQEEREWRATPVTWKSAPECTAVGLDDVLRILVKPGNLSRERLIWLRRFVWHALNDRHRYDTVETSTAAPTSLTPDQERENMEALLSLIGKDGLEPRDMATRGELLRQLGRFDESVAVLSMVLPDGYSEVRASRIIDLARAGDTLPRPLGDT